MNLQDDELLAASFFKCPSPELLEPSLTSDQREWWQGIRQIHEMVMDCWQSRLQRQNGEPESLRDPLVAPVEAKELDQLHYEMVWKRVDRQQALYHLLAACLPALSQAASNQSMSQGIYPVPSLLFNCYIQSEANDLFRISLLPYLESSTGKAKKLIELMSRYPNLSEHEVKKGRALIQAFGFNETSIKILSFCRGEAEKNPNIQLLYQRFLNVSQEDNEIMDRMLRRTRDSKTFDRLCSFAWKIGEIHPANQHGGTYS